MWIEAPEGARRELRPFASYCRAHSRYRLSHDRPFRRDLHLTVDAAGHVFRTAGVHSIVAELWLASNAVLRSNTVEINIRPLAGLSDAGRHKRRLLEQAEIAILTAHKLDRADGQAVAAVEAFLDDGPASPAKALLRYCAGRALLEQTLWTRGADELQTLRERALAHLRPAADDAALGAHRQRRCRVD